MVVPSQSHSRLCVDAPLPDDVGRDAVYVRGVLRCDAGADLPDKQQAGALSGDVKERTRACRGVKRAVVITDYVGRYHRCLWPVIVRIVCPLPQLPLLALPITEKIRITEPIRIARSPCNRNSIPFSASIYLVSSAWRGCALSVWVEIIWTL